jgi:hypothetical protein
MNILSIDWDYFINATNKQRKELFVNENSPDPDFMTFLWSEWYQTEAGKEVLKMGIKQHDFEFLCKYLSDIDIITENHEDIVEMIKEVDQPVNIINIDFHHDTYDHDLDSKNCGNWVTHMINEGRTQKFIWIGHEDSDESPIDLNKVDDITILKNMKFDKIFLCRSDYYSPPHLDKYFQQLAQIKKNMTAEEEFFIFPRY